MSKPEAADSPAPHSARTLLEDLRRRPNFSTSLLGPLGREETAEVMVLEGLKGDDKVAIRLWIVLGTKIIFYRATAGLLPGVL